MTDDVYSIAKAELEIDEELLWYGVPNPKLFTFETFYHFRIELFMLLYSSTLIYSGFKNGFLNFFTLFGVVLVVLMMTFGTKAISVYSDYYKTVYVLTNKRCIVILCKNRKIVKSYLFEDIKDLEKKEYANDTGTIIFDKELYQVYVRNSYRTRVRETGFIRIDQFKKVETLISKLSA